MKTYIPTMDELIQLVKSSRFHVATTKDRDNFQQVSTCEGAVVCYYPSTGTLFFQGKSVPRDLLQKAMTDVLAARGDIPPVQTQSQIDNEIENEKVWASIAESLADRGTVLNAV